MISLHDLQQRCYDAFVFDDKAALLPFLEPKPLPASNRISVYQNNVKENFIKTLSVSFPVSLQLMGEDCFRSLAQDYYRRFPSEQGNLQGFGNQFSRLLQAYYSDTEFAYFADVAQLEWLLEEVRSAADAHPIDLVQLQKTAGEDFAQLSLRLHPAVRLMQSTYPVIDIWQAHQTEQIEPIHLQTSEQHVLLRRVGHEIELRPLSTPAYLLISHLRRGERLIDALTSALESESDPTAENPLIQVARLDLFCDAELRLFAR